MKVFLLVSLILSAGSAYGANWYLDSSVSTSGDGKSWGTAWKNLSHIKNLSPGDIVNISGGSTTKTYTWSGSVSFLSPSGNSANPITYRVSSEVGHNGIAVIDYSNCTDNQFLWAHPGQGYGQWMTWSGDVGDGTNHLRFMGSKTFAEINNSTGVKFKYLDISSRIRGYDSTQIEIDHLTFNLVNGIDGYIFGIGRNNPGTSYTTNSIHDCTLYIARNSTLNGFGDDGMKDIHHTDVYRNRFIGVPVTYTASQHGDAIQSLEAAYLRVRDNYFTDIAQYGVLAEYFNSGGHVQIYNNVFYNMHSQDISVGSSSSGLTITDIQIFNNTHRFVSQDIGAWCVALGGGFPNTTTTNSFVVNDLCYGTPTGVVLYQCSGCSGSGNTISNNFHGTAGVTFVDSNKDFRLQTGSTAVIDKGISFSAITGITTLDTAGASRASGSAWDIGAYEFVTAIIKIPPSAPRNLRAQ